MGIERTIYLDDFLENGIISEKHFRNKVKEINWKEYEGLKVLIKGCSSTPVPTWAYLILTANLSQNASEILYGEPCSAIKIFKK